MAGIESSAHDIDITSRIDCEVKTAISDLNEVILDALALRKLLRVDELSRTELPGPSLLCGIGVNRDDTLCSSLGQRVDARKADAANTEDGGVRVL